MKSQYDMLVIGGSAGSLSVVLELLPYLKKDWEVAIMIIFHRKDDDGTLVDILSHRTQFVVKEVEDKEEIKPYVIYLAPTDYHVLVEKDKSFSLDYSEKINYCRPSIDATFESAADVYGKALVALLLSGANADGVDGLKAVGKNGGLVIVQDPATAEVPYMPQQAIKKVDVDIVMRREDIENTIEKLYSASIC